MGRKFTNDAQMDMTDGEIPSQLGMQYDGQMMGFNPMQFSPRKIKNSTINYFGNQQPYNPFLGLSQEFQQAQMSNFYDGDNKMMRRDRRRGNLPTYMEMSSGPNMGQTGYMQDGQFTNNFLGMKKGGKVNYRGK
jgi:hypothetical protein